MFFCMAELYCFEDIHTGCHPSPIDATRFSAPSDCPPIKIGEPLRDTGIGSQEYPCFEYLPDYVFFMILMFFSIVIVLFLKSCPIKSNYFLFEPIPMPTINLPLDRESRVAICFAKTKGSRRGTKIIEDPN